MKTDPFLPAAVLLAALALPCPALAVNLVPNDSFETISACPGGFGWLYVATPWDTPSQGTSDCLNACGYGPFPPAVPANPLGWQAARTGVGYAGLIPLSASPDYREYLQAPLNAPLVAGATYVVTFYVSLADSAEFAIDRLGAYLSAGAVGPVGNWLPLPFTPQVESPALTFLNDAVNWTAVTGSFVAAGGEDHIVIGNFHDDATTNSQPGPGAWPGGSYYYVDDVSVEQVVATDQACCLPDGTCATMLPGECQAAGGTAQGAGTSCATQPCGATPAKRSSWGAVKAIYR